MHHCCCNLYMFLLSVVVQGLYLSYKRASKRLLGIIVIKLAFLYCWILIVNNWKMSTVKLAESHSFLVLYASKYFGLWNYSRLQIWWAKYIICHHRLYQYHHLVLQIQNRSTNGMLPTNRCNAAKNSRLQI